MISLLYFVLIGYLDFLICFYISSNDTVSKDSLTLIYIPYIFQIIQSTIYLY